MTPGEPAVVAPLGDGWLLERLGDRFVRIANGWEGPPPDGADFLDISPEGTSP